MGFPAYKRLSDFSVDQPKELRRDLQQMDREVEGNINGLILPPFGSVRRIRSDGACKLDEFLIVDCSQGSVKVTLPHVRSAAKQQTTRAIMVARTSASNTVTLVCVDTDTINRASSYVVPPAIGLSGIVLFDGFEYWI